MALAQHSSPGTLIIGAGHAGTQIAASLREFGDEGAITLINQEEHAPYNRPPLSKDFLLGEVESNSLQLRADDFYERARLDLIVGDRVDTVRLHEQGPAGAGIAYTVAGRRIAFDRLAIAVGARARKLAVPGAELGGIHPFRSIEDATEIRAALPSVRNVVVIGGGFVGLETAAVLRMLGKPVTIVEASERLMARAVAPVVSDFYREAHERRGSTVLLDTGVASFEGDDHEMVTGVRLADDRLLPADLVVVGVGLEPNTRIARAARLDLNGGIVVDAQARTSNPAVVAAGDCTVLPHPQTGHGLVRLESAQNAATQARVAAATLMGRSDSTMSVPWFWSDQGDLKLQIAGLKDGFDRYVVRGDQDQESFSVLYYQADRLTAIDAINAPRDYMAVRQALTRGINIPPRLATNPHVQIADLLKNAQPAKPVSA